MKSTGELFHVTMTTKIMGINTQDYRLVVVRELPDKQDDSSVEENDEKDFKAFTDILPEMSNEPEILFEFDPEGRIISANQTFFDKTLYTLNDIQNGLHFNSILFSEHDSDLFRNILADSVKGFNDFNLSCKN